MRYFVLVLYFTLLASSLGLSDVFRRGPPLKEIWNRPRNNSLEIVNGKAVTPNSVPFQALIEFEVGNGYGYTCGGSLISTTLVLTAAHCVSGTIAATVVLGVSQISKPTEPTREAIRSTNLIIHEKYDPTYSNSFDIALVKLPHAATLNQYVQVIPLGTSTGSLAGNNAVVYGWGLIDDETNESADYLMEGTVTIVDSSKCYDQSNSGIVCTMPGPSNQNPCYGDSGGPLVLNNQVIGIVSYGTDNCLVGPFGFTRVSGYLQWIESKMSS